MDGDVTRTRTNCKKVFPACKGTWGIIEVNCAGANPPLSWALSLWSISAHIFYHFYPTLKPSFFYFTRSRFTNNKTRHKTSLYWYKNNKHRLHCTQDDLPQDGLTASSYRLLDHQTIEGHVVLLDSPFRDQIVNQSMLVNHILDLTGFYQFHDIMKLEGSYQIKIGPNITIQSRTHYLCHLQLSLGCDS